MNRGWRFGERERAGETWSGRAGSGLVVAVERKQGLEGVTGVEAWRTGMDQRVRKGKVCEKWVEAICQGVFHPLSRGRTAS